MTDLINSIDMNLSFNNETIRVLGTSENPMFVVKDICKILGLSNVTATLRNIPDKWKCSLKVNTSTQGLQTSNVVNEAGLYKIIMRSEKPIAQPFQEFVCEEILPSIRNTGEYKYQKILDEKNKLKEQKEQAINKSEESQEEVKSKEMLSQKNKLAEDNKVIKHEKTNLVKIPDGLFNCNLNLPDSSSISIPMRDDGYINVTMLCKASGKDIKEWKKNKSSVDILNAFFSLGGIPPSQLLNSTRVGKTQHTFAHPDIAIQIAQWCSPSFALQVSRWTRELLVFGKVEIGNEKSDKELEYKLEERIKLLTEEKEEIINTAKKQLEESQEEVKKLRKKYVKQPKEAVDQKNVVYLMTSEESEKNGEYNVGKELDLYKRKESYNHNKLHDFKVIYYISCKNSKLMDILESVILTKLEKYRCKAGRDVFLLPTEDIKVFTNIFDECLKFYEGIDNPIYPKRTIQEDKEKQKERNIKYQEEHKEEIKKKNHEYHEDNKDILSAIKKEYYEKNADVFAKKQKEY